MLAEFALENRDQLLKRLLAYHKGVFGWIVVFSYLLGMFYLSANSDISFDSRMSYQGRALFAECCEPQRQKNSQTTCGKVNDSNVYTPPNYDTFTPPAAGGSYVDPVFGCTVTRITDAAGQFGWQNANHWYSTSAPINANDTYVMVTDGSNRAVVDIHGNIIVPPANFPSTTYKIFPWDITNPNVFYYGQDNKLMMGTITGTPPNATVTQTTLHTFPEYTTVYIPDDLDISEDGLHIWMNNCGGQNCTGDIFVMTLNAGNGAATSATKNTVISTTFHKLVVTPGNRVTVDNGPIYNSDGSVYGNPPNPQGHLDWDADGYGFSTWGAGTTTNACPGQWGWGILSLATLTVQNPPGCLANNPPGNSSHISERTLTKHWAVYSTSQSDTCPGSSFYCYNNPTNLSGWSLWDGEIFIWDQLGSNVVRLAHHRSRTAENYWAEVRAAISRSGKYIVFDSNFNQSSLGSVYQDVYVVGPLY